MAYNAPLPAGGQGLRPNAYSGVGGSVLNQQVISIYDYYAPNELMTVMERHTQYASFKLCLNAMGFSRGTAAPTTGHYEAPWSKNLVTVGSTITAATGPGEPHIIELDAADMFNASVTVNGAASRASYPIVGEELMLPGDVLVRINAKNTSGLLHQLTLVPKDSTVDLSTIIIDGAQYFVATNSHGEGSGLPSGKTHRLVKYSNTFQIIKEAVSATGSEMTNETYFHQAEDNTMFKMAGAMAHRRYEQDCDGALFWGQRNTNTANLTEFNVEQGFDVAISGTDGYNRFATENGLQRPYVTYTINDFDDTSEYYELERVANGTILCMQGIGIRRVIENELAAWVDYDASSTIYKNLFGGLPTDDNQPGSKTDSAVMFGFSGIKKNGWEYGFKTLHCLNERIGAGASGYNYKDRQYLMPTNMVADKKNGKMNAVMGYEWKQEGSNSRHNIMGALDGAGINRGNQAVNPNDIARDFMLSELAFHGSRGNQIIVDIKQ